MSVLGAMIAAMLAALPAAVAGPSIDVGQAAIQMPMPGSAMIAGYVSVTNNGSQDDRLLAVSSPLVGSIEIHEVKMEDGVMSMRPVLYGMAIPAGETLAFTPSTMHLMLEGVRRRLVAGKPVPLRLTFLRAGVVQVMAQVSTEAYNSN
jgi:copper(I)-binding protein